MGRYYYEQGLLIHDSNCQLHDDLTALQTKVEALVNDAMINDPDVGKPTQ